MKRARPAPTERRERGAAQTSSLWIRVMGSSCQLSFPLDVRWFLPPETTGSVATNPETVFWDGSEDDSLLGVITSLCAPSWMVWFPLRRYIKRIKLMPLKCFNPLRRHVPPNLFIVLPRAHWHLPESSRMHHSFKPSQWQITWRRTCSETMEGKQNGRWQKSSFVPSYAAKPPRFYLILLT